MLSRIMPAIVVYLNEGHRLNKYRAADIVHCDPRTAARYLLHLHVENIVRIESWTREHGAPIPWYINADGKPDAPRPAPISKSPKLRNEIRRAYKANKKQIDSPPALGFWGL